MSSKVGIHLNAFPLASEVFITEQARTMREFEPHFFVRQQLAEAANFKVLPIQRNAEGSLRKKLFALFPGKWAWGEKLADLNLIHAHFGTNGVYALPIAKALDIPLIVTFHGYDATVSRLQLMRHGGVSGMMYALNRHRLVGAADKIIVVSEFLKKKMLNLGFPEKLLEQHYIGADLQKFSVIPLEKRNLDVVCVARQVEAKGIRELILAFSKVCSYFPEARLRLVGDGPDRGLFTLLVGELKLTEKVVFEGALPHVQVANIVSHSAIAVLFSKKGKNGSEEAFGLSAIEASAAGLPVIVSRHGGLTETVQHNETGFIVEESNVDELAGSLKCLLDSAALRETLGNSGRSFVEKKFNLHHQTSLLEVIYKKVIS
ncbi:glycosyltransferase [Iodobacter sp.]|uniref:glycosyltransferase n=1 Tax=Iodobacter sp. TaxID=1915058 RepID=UPI0025CE3D50|nr:glycosyltransferase [Iodobacter sp.]